MNPHLKSLREQYESLKNGIEGIQTRASEANRDLTEDELRSVTEQAEKAKKVAADIELVTEFEVRNRKVADLAASLDEGKTEVRTSTTVAKDRDPGHYRSEKDGGTRSFFADALRSREGDEDARQRLAEHKRALATTTEGPGLIPPKWLVDEFLTIDRQGRALANAARRIPMTDPRPITLPGQTVGTSVAVQSAENATTAWTNSFDTSVVTVTPDTIVGGQEVSRQFIDSATPAIDQLIWSDLVAAYDVALETRLGNILIANGTALAATEAQFGTMTTKDTNGSDLVVRAATAVSTAIYNFPDVVAMTHQRYGEFLKLKDTTGRPLMVGADGGPVNVVGAGDVRVVGRIHGLGVVVSQGMAGAGADPDEFVVYRAADLLLFESPILRFRYDEPKGPETIRLGVFGYVAAHLRRTGAAKRVEIDTTP